MSEAKPVKEWNGLNIFRLEDGGFFIVEKYLGDHDRGLFTPPMFACTTMKEALDYTKAKIGRGR